MAVIDVVVGKVEPWRGIKDITIQPLSGGLTNRNYKVMVNGTPYFVRVPGESTELLAVDRKNEYFNSLAAAESGVGPRVVFHIPDMNVMVLEFLTGQTMSRASLNAAGMPARIAKAIKQLHSGPRFLKDFNMFRLTEYYLSLCDQRQITIPDGFRSRLGEVEKIEKALETYPVSIVPCNNDLLAENYIEDGTQLRIIDYEYSGNNDPYFELGNTCQEQQYNDDQIKEVCQAYFGETSAARLARLKLNMIMSDVGWTLWAAIQARISKIEYDFWGWAIERWSRAEVKFRSSEFPEWLKAVSV